MQGFWQFFIVEGALLTERDVIFRLFRRHLRFVQMAHYQVQERHERV